MEEVMSWADAVNGLFEGVTGIASILNCRQLYKDKEVKGVVWWFTIFYTLWGFWNLYYYPSLNQWFSFAGGLVIVAANAFWVGMVIYYRRKLKIKTNQQGGQ